MEEIITAFLENLIITACSCILPIIVGAIYLSIAKKKPEKKQIAPIVSLIPDSTTLIAIMTLLLINLSYLTSIRQKSERNLLFVLFLSFCFITYIPKRQNRNYSVKKNLFVNSLGLFSTVFMWSLVPVCFAFNQNDKTYLSYYK